MSRLSKKGQETRQKIIDSAFDLFHERGIHATSIDDILKKSGSGKSQFYHYFKNKEAIIHELLQNAYHMIKDGKTHLQPIHSWKEFRGWLDTIIEFQANNDCSRACPIGQIAGQISDDDELLRQDIQLIFEAMKSIPRDFFITLKARGELVDHADPDSMADLCIAATQGAATLSKVTRDLKPLKNTTDYLLNYMESFKK